MSHYLKIITIFLCVICFKAIHADPWFTGPILAAAGHTVPRGHTNFEIYGIDVFTNGQYNESGHVVPMPQFKSLIFNPLLTHGFTDWLDVQVSLPYVFNSTQGRNYRRLSDSSIGLGFQLAEQKKSKWLPDIRLFLQETFPTGSYEHLIPEYLGTDATGLGSYRTMVALNLQYLAQVTENHYLRSRLIISRRYSSSVDVNGFNSFGGTALTRGRVNPGAEDNFDLAFEYTLTQNWVAVMEGYISQGKATQFDGILDIVSTGAIPLSGQYSETGLAPALEYNFNANVGLIGGVWFPVAGKNTSNFMSYVLALNAYW